MGGLAGARIATAGDDGLRAWRWEEVRRVWEPETVQSPSDLEVLTRDVDWKTWDGICEILATATCQTVIIWQFETAGAEKAEIGEGSWHVSRRVDVGHEVWKLSWMDMGNII